MTSKYSRYPLVLLPLFLTSGFLVFGFTPYHIPNNAHRKLAITTSTTTNLPKTTSTFTTSTRLYDKKWGPRWNPRPDSEYYNLGRNNKDIYGGRISSRDAMMGRRSRTKRFRGTYVKYGILSVKRWLVTLNILSFVFQIYSAIVYVPVLNSVLALSSPKEEPFTASELVEQFILGQPPICISGEQPSITPTTSSTSILSRILQQFPSSTSTSPNNYLRTIVASTAGPYTTDFSHNTFLNRRQPHRYLTSGFLHSSLLHLALNTWFLCKIPKWVEDNGGSDGKGWFTGRPFFTLTYILSIIVGNRFRDYATKGSSIRTAATTTVSQQFSLGAAGGICGLNGARYILAKRMDNNTEARSALVQTVLLALSGLWLDGGSNGTIAAHLGGFVCGLVVATLFGPMYGSDPDGQRRTAVADEVPWNYRRIMGGGRMVDRGLFPMKVAWAMLVGMIVWKRTWWNVPFAVSMGWKEPGVLSGLATSVVL